MHYSLWENIFVEILLVHDCMKLSSFDFMSSEVQQLHIYKLIYFTREKNKRMAIKAIKLKLC